MEASVRITPGLIDAVDELREVKSLGDAVQGNPSFKGVQGPCQKTVD